MALKLKNEWNRFGFVIFFSLKLTISNELSSFNNISVLETHQKRKIRTVFVRIQVQYQSWWYQISIISYLAECLPVPFTGFTVDWQKWIENICGTLRHRKLHLWLSSQSHYLRHFDWLWVTKCNCFAFSVKFFNFND